MDYKTACGMYKNAALQKRALFGIKPGALDNVKGFFRKALGNADEIARGKARRAAGKNSDDIVRRTYKADDSVEGAAKNVDAAGAKAAEKAAPPVTTKPAEAKPAKTPDVNKAKRREIAKKLMVEKPKAAVKWTGGKLKGGAKKTLNGVGTLEKAMWTTPVRDNAGRLTGERMLTSGSVAKGGLLHGAVLGYPYWSRFLNEKTGWDVPRWDYPWMDKATGEKPSSAIEQARQEAAESDATNLIRPENPSPYNWTDEEKELWGL